MTPNAEDLARAVPLYQPRSLPAWVVLKDKTHRALNPNLEP